MQPKSSYCLEHELLRNAVSMHGHLIGASLVALEQLLMHRDFSSAGLYHEPQALLGEV